MNSVELYSDISALKIFEITHIDTLHFYVIVVIVMKVEICHIIMVSRKAPHLFIGPIHVHKSKIEQLLSFLCFRSDIVAWRNLKNFVNTKIVVREIFYIQSCLEKIV